MYPQVTTTTDDMHFLWMLANASELIENDEEMFPWYYIDADVYIVIAILYKSVGRKSFFWMMLYFFHGNS